MNPLYTLIPVLFAGGIVSMLAGSGFGMILIVSLSLFYDIKTAVMLTGLLGFVINTYKFLAFRRQVQWHIARWYIIFGIPCSFIGALLLNVIPEEPIRFGVAFLCLSFVVLRLFHLSPRLKATQATLIISSIATGLVGGIMGNSALVRNPVLLSLGLTKETFMGTAAFIAFCMNIGRSGPYIYALDWSDDMLTVFGGSAVAIVIGLTAGKQLLPYVSKQMFEKLLLAVIFLGAVRLLLG